MNNNFEDIVFNRHSVKVFDEKIKICQEEMIDMLNEACLAPSSVNMQPWRFVVVESDAGKQKLRPLVKFNTRQCDTSSAMVLIFGDMKCYEKAGEITDLAVKKGYMSQEVKEELLSAFLPFYENATETQMNDIVKIDSALAAMQFMLVARRHGYDTNAIGGFEADQLVTAFELDSARYVPVIILAIGKSEYESHPSVRLDAQTLTEFV